MLLRLLPTATPSQPTPPTILFTLPLPAHPYTSKSLPLPPNLMAHRSVCLQEDVECNNVLLGEKSSWISGVVDDVTFSLPKNEIRIHFIDGTETFLPLEERCVQQLERVMLEVQLSFKAPSEPPSPTVPSHKRSTSALLLTLLSPLLSSPAPRSNIDPARVHRRQARSLLVDAYRQHVLPSLKERLPSAYLTWAIDSEVTKKMADFEILRSEINFVLDSAGIERLTRYSSSSSSSESDSPMTPATSVFSCDSITSCPSKEVSPQSFLLSIPPAHSLPPTYRSTYSTQLAKLTHLASRLGSIKKLGSRYEREESKRAWLDGLEAGRNCDKAMRRAWSNGLFSGNLSKPVIRSKLWRSTTPETLTRSPLSILEASEESFEKIDQVTQSFTESCLFDSIVEIESTRPSLVSSHSDESLADTEWDSSEHSTEESSSSSSGNSSDEDDERHPYSIGKVWPAVNGRVKAQVVAWDEIEIVDGDGDMDSGLNPLPRLVYA